MSIDNLVSMANQIGTFFASYPDKTEGRTEIANHLQRYWAPRMRKQLYAHIDLAQGEGLAPFVIDAIIEHRRDKAPPPPPGGANSAPPGAMAPSTIPGCAPSAIGVTPLPAPVGTPTAQTSPRAPATAANR